MDRLILKECSECMVYAPDGSRLQKARVVHTNKEVFLYFNSYKMQDCRFKAMVDFYDWQVGLVQAGCDIVIKRNPDFPNIPEPWIADCKILRVVKVVQRQRDIRVKVNIEIECSSDIHGKFHGTIGNLSAGGLYLVTTQPLMRHEPFLFKYKFRTMERELNAVVLWGKGEEKGSYGYGCRFIKLRGGDEAAIREFVYQKQLERLKLKA
ncbi:PilZ domain-containing protein [Hungatella hathewayi]|uniref:PilZ domain-containing protein n=1 Tax=Hungatella hathewayi TaxID=154046 RepID=UPI0035619A47